MTRRRTVFVLLAAACGFAAVCVWALAFHTATAHDLDTRLIQRIARWPGSGSYALAEAVSHLCNALPAALLGAGVVALAASTHGARGALVVTGVLLVPNVVTQVLKDATALDRSHLPSTYVVHVSAASWPSGHATVAMALALGLVLAAPAAWRLLAAAVGLCFAAAIGLSVVMIGWHYPSDVAGGYLVAAAGACVGAALLPRLSLPASTAALPTRSLHARG